MKIAIVHGVTLNLTVEEAKEILKDILNYRPSAAPPLNEATQQLKDVLQEMVDYGK